MRRALIALFALGVGLIAAGCRHTEKAPGRFEKDILAFEARDKTNPPPAGAILFIGSSSIRLWETLAADFPGFTTINRGFGGSEIEHSVDYVGRIVLPYRPRQIVMYAGGNDINAGKTPARVFADFQAFVTRVHRSLPRVPIAYISIAPNPARWAQVERVREANALIRDYCQKDSRLRFIDAFSQMLGSDGLPRPDIFREDRLHMNTRGYALWREIVAPYLLSAPPIR